MADERSTFIDSVFNRIMEDYDSGYDLDYIKASKDFVLSGKSEEYKTRMDYAAAKLINRLDQLETRVTIMQGLVNDLFNQTVSTRSFDFENFNVRNGCITKEDK